LGLAFSPQADARKKLLTLIKRLLEMSHLIDS